ncbi:MAG: SAM-dependent methyltransferase [Candidatus Thermoplasmatota archaeon]|nr:SAM-dependent methyltransferase [Candidatus Thermoplasmatota archaeon]
MKRKNESLSAPEYISVIENCEPEISDWVFLEYKNASEIAQGKIIYARTKDRKLEPFGIIDERPFTEIIEPEKTIILDPAAEKPLAAEDFQNFKYLVFGGICGDYPPKARTGPLVSCRMPKAELRHLGPKQLSTDSAVLMVKLISLGAKIEEIETTECLTIEYGEGESFVLPFGYVVLNDKIMVTPGLLELLKKRREDEGRVF